MLRLTATDSSLTPRITQATDHYWRYVPPYDAMVFAATFQEMTFFVL